MIKKYVSNIAVQIGLELSKISLVDGQTLGCRDTHLLSMSIKERIVSTIIYQSDLENLVKGIGCDRLEIRIRMALSRLQLLVDLKPQNTQ